MATIDPLIITYNCGREPVNPALFSNRIISSFPTAAPEILVFALEELAPLAYSFLGGSLLTAYLSPIHRTVALTARKWGDYSYESVLSRNLGMTALMVFVRADFVGSIVSIEAGGVGVGYHEMGNKGAVAARLGVRNSGGEVMGLTFVAAHLAPMEEAVKRRNEDWREIVRGLVLSSVKEKATVKSSRNDSDSSLSERQSLLGHSGDSSLSGLYSTYASADSSSAASSEVTGSHLIVAGDLNYRTASTAPRPYARAGFPRLTVEEGSPHHYKTLLPADQLTDELKSNRTCHGLTEAPIAFPPTYKYSNAARREIAKLEDGDLKPGARRDEAADTGLGLPSAPMDFPWAGHRWPSWCDRILWLPTSPAVDEIQPLKYTSLKLMSSSDHQPVALQLRLPLRPVRVSGDSDPRRYPPFQIDPGYRSRRLAARRREVVVGAGAFMVMTSEGQAILLALVLGTLGGWALMSRLL